MPPVTGVESDLLFGGTTRACGHDIGANEQAQLFGPADSGHVVVGERGRHRVVVAVKAHQGKRVGAMVFEPTSLEGLGGKRQQSRPIVFQPPGLGVRVPVDKPLTSSRVNRSRNSIAGRSPFITINGWRAMGLEPTNLLTASEILGVLGSSVQVAIGVLPGASVPISSERSGEIRPVADIVAYILGASNAVERSRLAGIVRSLAL